METPTATTAGSVLILFGGALLVWCALELRLRHHLRRHGVPATARVVVDGDPYGELYGDPYGELDTAPLLSYCTLPTVGATGMGQAESVLSRPRGHTRLRRPAELAPGAVVQVAYDARRPSRVVLAASETRPSLPSDVFWALLGTSALAVGLTLIASVLTD
ncbi:DUF3592 domain-containing protein [Saccharothrix sp. ST-888]|uniref:DUF3592 domain-containing protein n=1 Tax=Saccharothrix sp. ST-888 TaxID=1427391 RepID=UPI0005ED3703|nr:DUF3592 domain-containing protein [Saccharothrix sp. ST-888]KJK59516.1 hypothetical protein UK12_03670 [Saccharothrix sp. ST-888]